MRRLLDVAELKKPINTGHVSPRASNFHDIQNQVAALLVFEMYGGDCLFSHHERESFCFIFVRAGKTSYASLI